MIYENDHFESFSRFPRKMSVYGTLIHLQYASAKQKAGKLALIKEHERARRKLDYKCIASGFEYIPIESSYNFKSGVHDLSSVELVYHRPDQGYYRNGKTIAESDSNNLKTKAKTQNSTESGEKFAELGGSIYMDYIETRNTDDLELLMRNSGVWRALEALASEENARGDRYIIGFATAEEHNLIALESQNFRRMASKRAEKRDRGRTIVYACR
ncbi:hypothetical protein BDQ17DRAFT_1413009 [Cyathus striatus]|nr:hypothetical protein BDQ17DRAFT_1413009 [Cyathus striatus]